MTDNLVVEALEYFQADNQIDALLEHYIGFVHLDQQIDLEVNIDFESVHGCKTLSHIIDNITPLRKTRRPFSIVVLTLPELHPNHPS